MTDVNILKYLLFTNEKMNRRMSAILFTLETAFYWECRGALMGNMLTVYTRFAHGIYGVIYTVYKPIRLQEIYLQYYNKLSMFNY